MPHESIAVIGAGPAGITAAWELLQDGYVCDVYESDCQVGGISKTVLMDGWRFDLGGHRFFTKVEKVEQLWREMLPPSEFQKRPRKSRIFYQGKFFDYPLKPINALVNLGLIETFRCLLSLVITKLNPPKDQSNFENWVAARFGWRLYRIFFKTYTEKVWGIKADLIQADWAAQRIKNLSLLGAIADALKIKSKDKVITSLIDSFMYPKLGPGQLWESATNILKNSGVVFHLNTKVTGAKKITEGQLCLQINDIKTKSYSYVFSSLPLSDIPSILNAPSEIITAGKKLKYRDFLIVALPVIDKNIFDDNWIYIHDGRVKVGRIQNYGSWSSEMVKPGETCLGLEYFVNQDDELWNMSDDELIELAKSELRNIGFSITQKSLNQGFVVRVPKAYPVYDKSYRESVTVIREWLEKEFPNWYQIGRNGQHRYNNQDHSMMTAVIASKWMKGLRTENYWEVNVDGDYHESNLKSSGRIAPEFG